MNELKEKIKAIMLGPVKDIVMNTRKGNMTVIEEKSDGDSATNADISIGQLFVKELKALLPGSIVINEEDFNEEVFEQIKTTRYVWVVDPIDGTKAFRTPGNNEYCIAVALLDDLKPVLSVVYAPEYLFEGEIGLMFEATEDTEGVLLNGKEIKVKNEISVSECKCINHIHRDTETNAIEKAISSLAKTSETIRAYDGHSTLVNYALVAAEGLGRVFTRRGANIWDIVQSAYLVEKLGGCVYYPDGREIFPIKIEDLKIEGSKLLMEFNIASSPNAKNEIINRIRKL